jgi:hypothetical protein
MPRSLATFDVLGPDVQGLLPRHLAVMLQAQLPPHLVPWSIFVVDDLLRSPSLKLDGSQLAQWMPFWRGFPGIDSPVVAEVTTVPESVSPASATALPEGLSKL